MSGDVLVATLFDPADVLAAFVQRPANARFVQMPVNTPREAKPALFTHVGINLGAPGDRLDADDFAWVVLASKALAKPWRVPACAKTFRLRQADVVAGDSPWFVCSTGVTGAQEYQVPLGIKLPRNMERKAYPASVPAARTWTVRLHFLEPLPEAKPGDRVFTVTVQGKAVLRDLDVAKEAGGPRRAIVREVKDVAACNVLKVSLSATAGEPVLYGIELVSHESSPPKNR